MRFQSAWKWRLVAGATLVVPGVALGQFPPLLNLSDLDGSNGFVIYGIETADIAGASVAGPGDVNADGVKDLLVGAPGPYNYPPQYFGPGAGYAYVVFKSRSVGGAGVVDLQDLDGSNGFTISGLDYLDSLGIAVSAAGDFNGDQESDFVVGAYRADPLARPEGGEIYVMYGGAGVGASGTVSPAWLNGTNGFIAAGPEAYAGAGVFVDSAGDFNDDGWPDVLIGAPWADPHGEATGQVYVVYGGPDVGVMGFLDLGDLDGTNGLTINGTAPDDRTGSCAGLGDFNGDSVDDIAIGAYRASPGGVYRAGQVYVVYGDPEWSQPVLELDDLNGANGFVIDGTTQEEHLGIRVASVGDINADGFQDLAMSTDRFLGSVFILFGGRLVAPSGRFDLGTLNGSNGFRVPYYCGPGGAWQCGQITGVGGAGDLNGDSVADLAIGNLDNWPDGPQKVAVLYGAPNIGQGGIVDTSTLNGTNGFLLLGTQPYEQTGISIHAAGDVNDDGVVDLIIGAPYAQPPGRGGDAGKAYVVFGIDTGDPADSDDDGDVDLVDFITFQLCFVGSNDPRAPGCARPDLDRDGDVDLADFLIFQQHFTGSR